LTRFYGAYANRIRNALLKHQTPQSGSAHSQPRAEGQSPSVPSRSSRASWARLFIGTSTSKPPCTFHGPSLDTKPSSNLALPPSRRAT
jgi:hypothetical protein